MGGFWWCIQGFLWSLCPVVLGGLHKPCSSELCVINSSASHAYLKTIPTLHLFFSPPLSLIFSDPYFSPQQSYTRSEFSPYFPKPCHFTLQCLGLGELLFSRQQALCKLMSITGQKVQQGKPSTGTFLLTPPAPSPSASWFQIHILRRKERKKATHQRRHYFAASEAVVSLFSLYSGCVSGIFKIILSAPWQFN